MIRFESVTKDYPDGTLAVHDLSLEAASGQITVLVGPSGCGKTTSLRMVNRIVNVVVALTVYTLALLVRSVVDGLSSVPAHTLATAAALGHTSRQRLVRVQLPLAVPVMAAGLRVAAVSNVSLVSVASVIGTAQLGQLFLAGNNTGTLAPIVLGLVFFSAIALIFDLTVVGLTRLLTPWRTAVAS
jgi:osmoprotectant transport system permease protein